VNYSTALDELTRKRRHWLADHPGILTRIARQNGVSQQYVTQIFHGCRPGKTMQGQQVRVQLRLHGAPGFEEATKAAA
jgi:hypothetical protein